MIKRLLFGIVLLLLIVGGLSFLYLGSAVKAGIEYAGGAALKTEVLVESVTLSPLNGKGSIRGLTLANPEGFSEGAALALGAIELELLVGSVFEDVIEIDLLRIAQPQIRYETTLRTDNLRTLLANLPKGSGAQPASSGDATSKRLLIKRIEILGPQLTVVTAIGSAPITLPDIVLSDIGGGSGGASAAQAAEAVIRELLAAIGAANLPSLDQLREGVEDRARQEVDQLEQRMRDRVNETVEDALGISVDGLGDRLRNLRN
jgi:hypothetical protein